MGLVILTLLAGCAGPAAHGPTPDALPPAPNRTPTLATAAPPVPAKPTAGPPASPTESIASTPRRIAIPATVGTPAPVLSASLITRTTQLDIYRVEGGLQVATLLELAPEFEQAIVRVGARIGARLNGRVAISFEPPQSGPCALRGMTLSHDRVIHLYYAPNTPGRRILPIVAHELGHQLQHDYYGWDAHRRADTILLEGEATWASGDYATGADGRPAWASEAERALAEGRLLALTADLEQDCRTTTRNTAYTGWASFVAFLLAAYGRERFDALYRSGRGHTPGSADYEKVYGKSLATLDQEWRKWLADGRGAALMSKSG
jgi:hypothetical protein